MKKVLTWVLAMVSMAVYAQDVVQSERIYVEGHAHSLDTRNIVWGDAAAPSANPHRRVVKIKADADRGERWIDRIQNMPQYLTDFYNTYADKVQEVLDGGHNWLSDPTRSLALSNGDYATLLTNYSDNLRFEFPKNASEDVIKAAASDKVRGVCTPQWNEADGFLGYLILCLTYDNPEAFWLSSYFQWTDSWSYSYRYYASQGYGTIDYDHNIYFTLKNSNFDHRRDEFLSEAAIDEGLADYNRQVATILSGATQANRYGKVAYFNDWLTKHNCYSSAYYSGGYIPTIVWSPLSALRGSTGAGGPVCEGYARAFKVLCDKSGIPCVLATGNAKESRYAEGESHMWNEVQMENGKWYAVDVTWNDPTVSGVNKMVSGYETDFWLLIGKNDVVAGSNFTFAESHPNAITWTIDADSEAMWQYSVYSLIEDHYYDVSTGIGTPAFLAQAGAPLHVFTLQGTYLGTFASLDDLRVSQPAASSSPLIVNGKKLLLK